MRFYSIGYFEINKIPVKDLKRMAKGMNILKAREKLELLPVYNFGSLLKKSRDKFFKMWNKSSEIQEEKSSISIKSFKDLGKAMGGML